MDTEPLAEIAALLHERNAIDAKIADIINKPMTSGHLGEWIAGQVFDIALESVANAKGVDGCFSSGPLKGSTVNVKWYLRREGILDMSMHDALDYYLVLTGPLKRSGMPKHRPWRIDAVYLFDARSLAESATSSIVRVLGFVTRGRFAAALLNPRFRVLGFGTRGRFAAALLNPRCREPGFVTRRASRGAPQPAT